MKGFYIDHSIYSNPMDYHYLFADFPSDIAVICHHIHSLFLHYADVALFEVDIPTEKYLEMNNRYLDLILDNIIKNDANSLIKPRGPSKRVMGICRDSSLMLCSVLRSRGIAARLRSGYVNYFIPGLFLDGLVVEYFDTKKQRWCLVDTRTSQNQIDHYHLDIDFDLIDLPSDKFISAAKAWKLCRSGEADPTRFGSRQYRGIKIVRNRLIQDLALLNKQELLVWDVWGMMQDSVDHHFPLMDTLADLLLTEANNTEKIMHFYDQHDFLRVPGVVYMDSFFAEPRWTVLRDAICYH